MGWWSPKHIGFRGQLLGIVTVGIVGLALTTAIAAAWVTKNRTRKLMIAQGLQITGNLADQSLLALLYGSEENAEKPLQAILSFPDVLQAGIIDQKHGTLLSLPPEGDSNLTRDHHFTSEKPVLVEETPTEWHFVAPVFTGDGSGEANQAESLFLLDSTEPEQLGHVYVKMSKATLLNMQRNIGLSNTALAALFALALLFLMNLGIKRMTRPLFELSWVMNEAKSEETHIYAELEGPKEILHMAGAFNTMMATLEERDQRLRNHRESLRSEVAIRTRELVQARDAALTASRHKSEFLANMSHELRTPLQAVIGYADVVREDLDIEGLDEHVDDLERVIRNARRLLEMINNILDLAKVEAGRMEVRLEPVNLKELTREAVDTVQPMMKQNGNTLTLRICDQVGELHIDREKLLQATLNLLSNAAKFTRSGTVTLEVIQEERLLTVRVTDTGVGIAPDQQKAIFEEFLQVDGSTTRTFEGTGLGLAITRRFCLLMGGTIGVESEVGIGSTFTISLPLPIATGGQHSLGESEPSVVPQTAVASSSSGPTALSSEG